MKNGKKKVKKTITVKVSSAKKVVVTAEPAKTTNKPTNGPTNGPTKEPVKEPTATPTATIVAPFLDRRTTGRANSATNTNAASGSW